MPGSPLVKTLPSSAGRSDGWIPGLGANIPVASWPKKQNVKQKQFCKKYNKNFENGLHPKKKKKKNLKKKKTQEWEELRE